ncbi:MAG: glycosyltransferase family 39 protein [Anaerolineae bacterium]|nr:glycosyltransferase family 39 protein [Anaerolineae bacterium]
MRILNKVKSPDVWPGRGGAIVLLALLMVAIVAVHTYRFSDRNYREDEINTLHAAKVLSPSGVVQWMAAEGFHPALWRVTATSWADVFGDDEAITRYSSTLFTLLLFAFLFRLGTDLFDRQVGLIAVLIAGSLPFYQFYGHELRPYASLAASVVAMQLFFLRWLKHQNFKYALLFVLSGAAALHIHNFALYAFAAQGVTLLALVRWDRGLYLRAFGLFAAVGIAYSPWTLAVLHGALVTNEGGISYALPTSLDGFIKLNQNIQGILVFLVPGLIVPVALIYPFYRARAQYHVPALRNNPEWRRWYVIVLSLAILGLAFAGNLILSNLTPRNMMILIPVLAVLGGYLLRALEWRVRLVPLALIAAMGLFVFHPYAPDIPYRQMVAFMSETYEEGDLVVTNLNHHGASSTAMTYYLLDWLPREVANGNIAKEDMFHFVEPSIRATFEVPPDPIPPVYKDDSPETLALFESFLDRADRVFYISYYGPPLYNQTPLSESFQAVLEQYFTAVRSKTWITPVPESVATDWYAVTEYQRTEAGD